MIRDRVAADAITRVAEDYRRRGYSVTERPGDTELPRFLSGYRPDLVATREGESVVIEVKVGTRTSATDRLQEVASRVNREPGWRFTLIYVNPAAPDQITEAEPASLSELERRARDAESILRAGQPEAAFLLLWSTAEGALRLLGRGVDLPVENLPPSALIRELYSAGEISRSQFDTLMRLLPVRNTLTHGFASVTGSVTIEPLRDLVQALFEEVRTAER